MTSLQRVDGWLRRRGWASDAALAAGLAALLAPTSVGVLLAADRTPWTPVAVVAVGLGHLAVGVRRTAPRTAYAVGCAVMLALVLAPDVDDVAWEGVAGAVVPPILLPSALVYPVLLYSVSAWSPPPWPAAALGVGVLGAGLAGVRLTVRGDWAGPGTPTGWSLLVLGALLAAVLASWGLGRLRAVRWAYVGALEDRARRAEQERAADAERAAAAERERIAREMHDVVAHSLAVMVRQAEGGRRAAARRPDLAVAALEAVAEVGREALTDMRGAVGALRPTDAAAPQPTVDDVSALVDGVARAGVPVALEVVGEPVAVDRAVSLAAYRVVQEALTNVVKHAPAASAARVRLAWTPGTLAVRVSDDGGPVAPSDGGHGLVGMRERVALVGGVLDAGAADGGFRVEARLPTRGSR